MPDPARLILTWLVEEDDAQLRGRIDREVANNLPSYFDMGMPTEQITIAEVLKDAGILHCSHRKMAFRNH